MRKTAEETHFSDVCMLVFAILVANDEQHQPKDLVIKFSVIVCAETL